MKKILLTSLSALSMLAVTQASAGCHDHFKGFYGTLLGGYETGSSDVTREVTPGSGNKSDVNLGYEGALGGLALGYGQFIPNSRVYLGFEIFGDISNAESREMDDSRTHKLTLKRQYGYGAALKVGTSLRHKTLLYVKAGAQGGHWDMKSVSRVAGSRSASGQKDVLGYTFGLGAEMLMTKKVGVGAEVMHTRYEKFDFNHPNVVKYNIQPYTTDFKLFVSWKMKPGNWFS